MIPSNRQRVRMRSTARNCVAIAIARIALAGVLGGASQQASAQSILLLDTTVNAGGASGEAQEATALGYTVDIVDAATWGGMTGAQFASYDAIVFGDQACGPCGCGDPDPLAPARANRNVWGQEVNGSVIVIGTDPGNHLNSGGRDLMRAGIAFAVSGATTGLYANLTCVEASDPQHTPIQILDVFGAFTGGGAATSSGNIAHRVATHPALNALTDSILSNWGQSSHGRFNSWPSSFQVVVIAQDIADPFVASDGTSGAPYVLGRGEQLSAAFPCPGPMLSMDSLAQPGNVDSAVPGGTYDEGDYRFDGLPLFVYGAQHPRFSGSTAIHYGLGIPSDHLIRLRRIDGARFDVCSISLAEGPTGVTDIEPFVGVDAGGTGDVVQDFTLDGSAYYPQTFRFEGFDDVLALQSKWLGLGGPPATNSQWDNVCVCVGSCLCPPAVFTVSPGTFCVVGDATGVDWSWEVDSHGTADPPARPGPLRGPGGRIS